MASRNTPGTKNAGKTKEQRRREAREQAEKLRQEEARRARRNRIFLIVASLLVVALVAVAVYIIMSSSKNTDDDADSTKFTHQSSVITETAPENVDEWGGVSVGKDLVAGTSNDDALEVTIYTDYACHYCGQLEESFGSELEEMAANGEITLTYVPVNIYSNNPYAAMGSQADYFIAANDPEHYLAYRSLMWSKLSNPYLSSDGTDIPEMSDILDVAKEAGLSNELVSELEDALNAGTYADFVTQVTQQLVVDFKASTPTVVINDERIPDWTSLPDTIREYEDADAAQTEES